MNKKSTKNQGFTLLELLIVIAIIAILSVILVLVLDPSETLKKSRDSQRMSDLSTIKTALGLYSTSVTAPYMAGVASNAGCKGSTSSDAAYAAGDKIYYSYPSDAPGAAITDVALDAGSASVPKNADDPMALVRIADRALYEAKQRGRNRAVPAVELTTAE